MRRGEVGGWGPSGIGVCVCIMQKPVGPPPMPEASLQPPLRQQVVPRGEWLCQDHCWGPGRVQGALSPELGPPWCLPSEEGHQPDYHPSREHTRQLQLQHINLRHGPPGSRFLTGCSMPGQVGFDL